MSTTILRHTAKSWKEFRFAIIGQDPASQPIVASQLAKYVGELHDRIDKLEAKLKTARKKRS